MTTVQFVAGAGLGLLMFVMLANFVVFLYARGVIRAAVDEGARSGGRFGATADVCETRGRAVLDDLLGGRMGSDVRFECRADERSIRARATVTLHGWVPPFTPDWHFTVEGRSAREDAP